MKPRTVGDLKRDLQGLPDNLPLVSASDSEGNSFDYVYYSPSQGKFDGYSFYSYESIKEAAEDGSKVKIKGKKVVCIN